MELSAAPIEDLLDAAAPSSPQLTLWLAGHTLTAARLVSWNRAAGVLVCRGGNGYTDEDVHFLRAAALQGLTLRFPSARTEADRVGTELREALREAAGYPVGLVVRPDAFRSSPAELAAWIGNLVSTLALLEPFLDAFRAQIDQILLREGATLAILGGSTLTLEARPESVPEPPALRAAIAPLLL